MFVNFFERDEKMESTIGRRIVKKAGFSFKDVDRQVESQKDGLDKENPKPAIPVKIKKNPEPTVSAESIKMWPDAPARDKEFAENLSKIFEKDVTPLLKKGKADYEEWKVRLSKVSERFKALELQIDGLERQGNQLDSELSEMVVGGVDSEIKRVRETSKKVSEKLNEARDDLRRLNKPNLIRDTEHQAKIAQGALQRAFDTALFPIYEKLAAERMSTLLSWTLDCVFFQEFCDKYSSDLGIAPGRYSRFRLREQFYKLFPDKMRLELEDILGRFQ